MADLTPAVDRVQVPSRRKDGTVDQTENYEIIGDKETAQAAIGEQLGQMLVSAQDEKRAQEQAAENAEGELTPEQQARKDEHDSLLEQGKQMAEAEVEANWVDPASRQLNVETTATRTKRSRTTTNNE